MINVSSPVNFRLFASSQGMIFISYRRADTHKEAGQISNNLVNRFGEDQVFIDVASISLGVKHPGYLSQQQ